MCFDDVALRDSLGGLRAKRLTVFTQYSAVNSGYFSPLFSLNLDWLITAISHTHGGWLGVSDQRPASHHLEEMRHATCMIPQAASQHPTNSMCRCGGMEGVPERRRERAAVA